MDDHAQQPFDPFAAPPQLAEVVVAPAVPPRKRRSGLLLVAAALVVIGVVAGVALATRGDSSAGYSLKSAASAAAQADKVAFEMQMSAMGIDITMDARIDTEAGLMAMSAELPFISESGALEVIMDIDGKQMYMDASAIPDAAAVAPTKWVAFDLTTIPGLEDQLGSLTGVNPLDTATLFETASEVEEVGLEEVNGESVQHYVVTVDLADAMAAQPGVFDQLDDVAAQLPDTIAYDVWVTEDDQLRKMSFSLEVMGQTIELVMNVTAIGEIEPIVVPAADEVTDISDMLGG